MQRTERLSKTGIEYGELAWNVYSGCKHTQAECPTASQCWARKVTERFSAHYPNGFNPTFYLELLGAPLAIKQPKRILVSFMGDLFGAWNDAHVVLGTAEILDVVRACPQHQFLFLTKRPEALAQFNQLWSANAWVGISITGAETPARQAEMLEALHRVEGAGIRWLSYEPALGPLAFALPDWLDWFVVGAQTGKGATPFDLRWLGDPPQDGRSYWQKNNLARYLDRPLIQELPQ